MRIKDACKRIITVKKGGIFLLTVVARTLVMYLIILISMKFMGKRQLGQMQISEFITAMILSELAALPISDHTIPIIYCLVPLSVIITTEVILSFISLKNPYAQRFLESSPTIIVDKGVLNQKALVDNRITLRELLVELRIAGFASISEVQYVYLEPNGKFSIIPKAAEKTPTARELGVKVNEPEPDVALIIDGKVIENGLKYLGKTKEWLTAKTLPHRAEDIFLFSATSSGKYTTIIKEKK